MQVQSLSEISRSFVLELIASGKLCPGDQIKEEEIAKSLQISRPPVREAFKKLEAEGLIVSKPRRGVFVPEITIKDAWEIYSLKGSLYSLALELAFDKLKPIDIHNLRDLIDKMSAIVASQSPDVSQYQQEHHSFHYKILEASGNNRLTQVASNLHLQIYRFSYKTFQERKHLIESMDYHQQIMFSIECGDKKRSCLLMQEHVLKGYAALENVFKRITDTNQDEKSCEIKLYSNDHIAV